jgi:hypothetical protein
MNQKFSSKTIRKALRHLEPSLGRATIDALIFDFETYGLPLANDHVEYSLADIKLAIEKIFGEAAPLFLERMVRALNAVAE